MVLLLPDGPAAHVQLQEVTCCPVQLGITASLQSHERRQSRAFAHERVSGVSKYVGHRVVVCVGVCVSVRSSSRCVAELTMQQMSHSQIKA